MHASPLRQPGYPGIKDPWLCVTRLLWLCPFGVFSLWITMFISYLWPGPPLHNHWFLKTETKNRPYPPDSELPGRCRIKTSLFCSSHQSFLSKRPAGMPNSRTFLRRNHGDASFKKIFFFFSGLWI